MHNDDERDHEEEAYNARLLREESISFYTYRCLVCGSTFASLVPHSEAFHDHAEHCEGIENV